MMKSIISRRGAAASFLAAPMVALAAAAVLAGCAAMPERIAAGTPREQVLSSLGAPTATWPLAGGATRLQYSREPQGREVYNVDLDAAGRVVRVTQVLDGDVLRRIPTDGSWTVNDLRREFGAPAYTGRVYSVKGEVWTYRMLRVSTPWLLHVDVDAGGIVRRAYTGIEPIRPWFGGD